MGGFDHRLCRGGNRIGRAEPQRANPVPAVPAERMAPNINLEATTGGELSQKSSSAFGSALLVGGMQVRFRRAKD